MGHLTWGLDKTAIQKEFPTAELLERALGNEIGFPQPGRKWADVYVRNFPGDCGSLLITGANNATEEVLREVIRFASMGGFSKIIATVVGDMDYEAIKRAVKAFRKCGFRTAARGKSNRNPQKDDFVFVYYNRNCAYKGY